MAQCSAELSATSIFINKLEETKSLNGARKISSSLRNLEKMKTNRYSKKQTNNLLVSKEFFASYD
jgi:hypothetical protein